MKKTKAQINKEYQDAEKRYCLAEMLRKGTITKKYHDEKLKGIYIEYNSYKMSHQIIIY